LRRCYLMQQVGFSLGKSPRRRHADNTCVG
jgi:hypothetical protein